MIKYLYILRPHHWVKNLLIFIPVITSHEINELSIKYSFLAFIAFSLIASSGYVINDIIDLRSDRKHPYKKKRPIASGLIKKSESFIMIFILILTSIIISSQININFIYLILFYLIATVAYSLFLKKIIIIDIIALSIFYTIRIYAGSEATNILISIWLFTFSVFFFLSLASVKRQIELVNFTKIKYLKMKDKNYKFQDLPIITSIAICSGYISIVIFAFYLNSPETAQLYTNPEYLWGICFVLIYWITRTIFLASRGSIHYDPVIFATKDNSSYACLVLILSFLIAGIF